jgi:hypothetical protein
MIAYDLVREENLPITLPFLSHMCGPLDHTYGMIKRWGFGGRFFFPQLIYTTIEKVWLRMIDNYDNFRYRCIDRNI